MNESMGELVNIAGLDAKIVPVSWLFIYYTNYLSGPVALILIYHDLKYMLSEISDIGRRKMLGGMLGNYYGPFLNMEIFTL